MESSFVDYCIASSRELDREFLREIEGVEVPLFSNKYDEWLKTESKLSVRSQVNYKRWIRKADEWICFAGRDFWTLLHKAWKASDFENIHKLCAQYESELMENKVNAEKDDEYGESPKEIGNWISAFRSYIYFIEKEMEKAPIEEKAQATLIRVSRETAQNLLFSNEFISWGVKNGKKKSTMESYVSFIKKANKERFCKTGYDLLYDFLPSYVKSKNKGKIEEMFTAMIHKLTERIDEYNETEMSIDALQNSRAALSAYASFIKEFVS